MTESPHATTIWPPDVLTLAVDVGGSGLKASVLDVNGQMIADRVRIETPYPCPPSLLVEKLAEAEEPTAGRQPRVRGFPGSGAQRPGAEHPVAVAPGVRRPARRGHGEHVAQLRPRHRARRRVRHPGEGGQRRRRPGLRRGRGHRLRVRDDVGHRLWHGGLPRRRSCCRTWSSPTRPAAHTATSTTSSATPRARRSGTRPGASGWSRRCRSSTSSSSTTRSTSAVATPSTSSPVTWAPRPRSWPTQRNPRRHPDLGLAEVGLVVATAAPAHDPITSQASR